VQKWLLGRVKLLYTESVQCWCCHRCRTSTHFHPTESRVLSRPEWLVT